MHILKFGGTSLGDANCMAQALNIVLDRAHTQKVGIVVSAVAGVTNFLVASIQQVINGTEPLILVQRFALQHKTIARQLAETYKNLHLASLDQKIDDICNNYLIFLHNIKLLNLCELPTYCQILSLGERLSVHIFAALLQAVDVDVHTIDSCTVIKTQGELDAGTPLLPEIKQRFRMVKEQGHEIMLMAGFIGSNEMDHISLLGRNGSDYSASLMAIGLQAELCEIWKDVDGIYTGDPHAVGTAQLIPNMSYEAAFQLVSQGAKVLHPKSIMPLAAHNIPLHVKNSFNPTAPGTKIM